MSLLRKNPIKEMIFCKRDLYKMLVATPYQHTIYIIMSAHKYVVVYTTRPNKMKL